MALDKPYLDVPGTTIFDAEQARKGYHLNQFCMSLMKAENRERFKANERAYLDEWAMTEEQKQAYATKGGAPHLDGAYTVFGEVVEGLDVLDAIALTPCDGRDRPLSDLRFYMRILE